MELERIVAEEVRKNDRVYAPNGIVTGTIEKYVLSVLPQDILTTIRAVALYELQEQEDAGNKASQILVDNVPLHKRGIDQAKRRVVMRFQDVENLIAAVKEIYRTLQRITRLQSPPKNSIVARNNFFLYLGNTNLGQMPTAMSKLTVQGVLTNESIVRVVGPLVNYGRRLFWNPAGASAKMNYYRVASKRGAGVRFLTPKGSGAFYPRFKPFKMPTLRKKANKTANPAAMMRSFLTGATPPGRIENAGQIAKRILRRNPSFKGLHFADGWIEYGPAVAWSKLADPRVPTVSVMLNKRGRFDSGA